MNTMHPADLNGWVDLQKTRIRVNLVRDLCAIDDRRERRMAVLWWTVAIVAPLAAYLLAGDTVRAIAAVMVAAVGGA